MNLALTNPFFSIVIRSFNRLDSVIELVNCCLDQDYYNFEIVIIEQSQLTHWQNYKERLSSIDQRIRLIRTRPKGSASARNLGVFVAKGDIVLLMDDDDLPINNDWISSHARHYKDPLCIGVSGRCIKTINEEEPYRNKTLAYERCLSYSFFLRGRDFTGINQTKQPVQWLHGLNSSIRKSYVIKMGGWYPYINNFDEHSFCFKLQKNMKPNEYLMFDPKPVVLRRFDIPGGLGKRYLPLTQLLKNQLLFYHRVVAKYYPIRFYLLFPIFNIYSFRYMTRWFKKFSYFDDTIWFKWFNKKNALRFYFIQEFFKYIFFVFQAFFLKKPKWNGPLKISDKTYSEYFYKEQNS
jgi:glycosyltransferase involved in cell wall biosynthesis